MPVPDDGLSALPLRLRVAKQERKEAVKTKPIQQNKCCGTCGNWFHLSSLRNNWGECHWKGKAPFWFETGRQLTEKSFGKQCWCWVKKL